MSKRCPRLIALPALLLALLVSAQAAAQSDPFALCSTQVARAEAEAGIPKGLLAAISAVESGRWDKERRAAMAWPWTVTSGSNGQFFASKAEAIAEVRRMKAQGIRNIDVGCMQINLHFHAEAFDSLDEAFDPATNASYAARFLGSLYQTHQDWMTAASHYHSATPELGARYRAKVLAAWNGEAAPRDPIGQETLQTADWTLVRPAFAKPADGATAKLASAPAIQPRALATAPNAVSPSRQPAKAQASAHIAPPPNDAARLEAKAFANAWREARLAEYKNRKTVRGGV
ncbi:Lytic transglycosylase [Rhodospirillaceae bacterium LM-1]|nr:Lytic transglycosylase [Rhodospirillaceae bacterium LM-1]